LEEDIIMMDLKVKQLIADTALPTGESYIFVYGTLKRGMGNNSILADSKFQCYATTEPIYSLFGDGIPFLKEGGKHHVWGEVYKVSAEVRQELDWLEGHPEWYRRVPVGLEGPWSDAGVEAYVYQEELLNCPQVMPCSDDEAINWWPVGRVLEI
jgi:gamma-glutamylcyclotransferase (GGCT)/AIG2-like uncharacterized protein YtfP